MHSKFVLYFLAMLTGLVVAPAQASAGEEKRPAVEQCSASANIEHGRAAWLAELAEAKPTKKAAASGTPSPRDAHAGHGENCVHKTPVARKEVSRE